MIRDPVSEATPELHEVVGKGKAAITKEQVAHSLIDLPKKKRTTDQFILARRDQTPPNSTTGPSSQHDDDTSEKLIHESSSTSDSERTESETEATAPKGNKDQGEVDSSTVKKSVTKWHLHARTTNLIKTSSLRKFSKKTSNQNHHDLHLTYKSSDDKAEDDTVDDDACKKTVQEPASEYDQALKNVLDKMMDQEKEATEQSDAVRKEFEAQCDSQLLQEKITRASSTNSFNTVSTPVNTASASRTFSPIGPSSGPSFVPFGGSFPIDVANLPHDPLTPELEDTTEIRSTSIFGNAYDDHDLETLNTPYSDQCVGVEADFNNMEPSTMVRISQKSQENSQKRASTDTRI
ncbi:hypothetical protein Tco_0534301 [Tanacetum coccineum]